MDLLTAIRSLRAALARVNEGDLSQ
jgi:hypothetical protein